VDPILLLKLSILTLCFVILFVCFLMLREVRIVRKESERSLPPLLEEEVVKKLGAR